MKKNLFTQLLLLLVLFLTLGLNFACQSTTENTSNNSDNYTYVKIEAKDATCTEDGNIEYYLCKETNKYYLDNLGKTVIDISKTITKAVGHKYNDEYACHDRTCTVCGHVETASAEHTFNDRFLCHDRTCRLCGFVVEATEEHDYEKISTTATCSQNGTATYKCKNCGDEKTEVDTNGTHLFESYIKNNDEDCVNDGTETSKCKYCNETDTRTIVGSAKGHTKPATGTEYTPTCFEKGYTLYVCETCHNEYKDDYVDVRQHNIVDVNVACTCEHGTLTGTKCSYEDCDYSNIIEADDKIVHSFDSNCYCSTCGKYVYEANIFDVSEKAYKVEYKNGKYLFTANESVLSSNQPFTLTICKEAVNCYLDNGINTLELTIGRKQSNMATYFFYNKIDSNESIKITVDLTKDQPVALTDLTVRTNSQWVTDAPNDWINPDGFSLKIFTGYQDVANWFTPNVSFKRVGMTNSFDFTATDEIQQVLVFNANALEYLKNQGYTHIRITYWGKNNTAINLAIASNNNVTGWTNNSKAGVKDFEINDSLTVIKTNYAKAEGIDGFNLTFDAINMNDVKNWFTSSVTCEQVAGSTNSFDFTATNALQTVLTFKSGALTYLKNQGYTHIRITYWGKNNTAINLGIAPNNNVTGWTNNSKAGVQDFEIDSLSIIKTCYETAEGVDGFNFIIEAVNYYEAKNWFTPSVTCEQVAGSVNSFDFTATNALQTVLTFKSGALTYLKNQGYTHIRITYWGKNNTAINLGIAPNNSVTGWTNNIKSGVQDFEIDSLSIIKTCYATAEGVDGFNFVIETVTK